MNGDEIHCHDRERESLPPGPFRDQEIVWRPKDGDHPYRGTGRTDPKAPGRIEWEPCTVCDKAYAADIHGDPYRTCGYCGSIHPADLLELIEAWGVVHWDWQGVEAFTQAQREGKLGLEWADFKYGWPHKLYATGRRGMHQKFYTAHLRDVDDALFAKLAEHLSFGPVRWARDHLGTKWQRVGE